MKLVPGGDAVEKMFLPSHLKGTAREAVKSTSFMTRPLTQGMEGGLGTQALEMLVQRARSGGTESLSEGTEEASGAVAKGLELSRAGQSVKLDEMAGEAAGQGMAVGGVIGGSARAHGAEGARRVQDQPTQPTTPPAPLAAREQRGAKAHTAGRPASPPPPAPFADPAAALSGYFGALQPGSGTTWSDVAAAAKKAQAEAEMLRQAEALLAQEVATSTTGTPGPAVPSATPAVAMPEAMDNIGNGDMQEGANAVRPTQVGTVGQTAASIQATAADPAAGAASAQTPTPSAANDEADAGTTETAPTTTQHGSAFHTAASQDQVPVPIDAQVQALDSGMLVVGGDQATILAHLQAGGVRGAEPFAGVTLVPVDQAALAHQVLSRPLAAAAGRRPVPRSSVPDGGDGQAEKRRMPDELHGDLEAAPRGDSGALFPRNVANASKARQASTEEDNPDYTLHDDRVPSSSTRPGVGDRTHAVSSDAATPVILRRMGKPGLVLPDARLRDLGAGRERRDAPDPDRAIAAHPRNGRDHLSAREPAQPDDGYSVGTAYLEKGAVGGSRSGGADQKDFTAPRATLVGLGIAERIAVAGSQALVGERVDSPEQLAELAQVYRDPRYETFRVFFIKDGEVVHATGVSARLPDRTPMVPAGMTAAQYLAQFREGMRRTGAQGYYILHNHPSGNPQPSPEDLELTEHLARQVPGMLAHVVINSNKYAVVTPQDAAQRAAPEAMVHLKHFGPDMLLRASKPMAALGETVQSSDALAMVGKSMQKPGWITLVGIGSDSRVRAIAEAPSSIFARSPAYLAASVRRFSRMSGSTHVFAVGDAGDINNSPIRRAVETSILRDAVTDLGQSLAEGGRMPARSNDRAHFRDNTESAHGRQPEFFNAHPTPAPMRMQTQRDGTLMIQGDPVQLQERLRQGGVDRVLRRKGGVLVGLDQVHKARQLLQQSPHAQASAGTAATGQQFSRSAPDQASRARGLPSKPATVQSVRAAVAKLTNSMGLLAEGRGRVVVATSADIKARWEPLVGEVDMGSQDTGLAQGFYDPNTNTIFLIADHIEAGQEMAVAAHELVHKHGKAVLGEQGWKQLHEVIGTWANRPEGSLERRVYDEATARVQASRPAGADETSYSSEELFPYAVQVAMELGVQPTALMPANSVQGWLARVRASLKDVLGKLTGNPQAFDGQDLVDLAFGIAQQERAGAAAVRWQGDLAWATGDSESPSASSPSPSSPRHPLQMSRDATGKDGAGAAKKKGPLGSEDNPRPVPLTDFKIRITTDNDPSNAITMLVDGEYVDFSSIEIKNGNPVLVVGKNGQKKSGEHVIIDAHGVTEAMLKAVIYYYVETTGSPPVELPGSLAYDNLENFRKEFDKHRKNNHNGTADDWAQAAIRYISFGKARQKLGYGVFEIKLSGSVNAGDLKGVPEEINVIARRN